MKKTTWQEPAAVICGLVAAMGGVSGIILTFRYGNAFLGLCGIGALAMTVPFIIGLWKKGEPKSDDSGE